MSYLHGGVLFGVGVGVVVVGVWVGVDVVVDVVEDDDVLLSVLLCQVEETMSRNVKHAPPDRRVK